MRGPTLPTRRFSLGKAGLPIKIIALCFLGPFSSYRSISLLFSFSTRCSRPLQFFPIAKIVEPSTMQWSIVMYIGVLTIAVVYYFVGSGRKIYLAPVPLIHH